METNLLPDKKVASIVKALAMVENGGRIPLDEPSKGQSGEMKSIFQFTPGTWKMYSKEILGQEAPLDKGSETLVAYGKVKKWLDDGLKPEQIASIWNSGKPDSYLQDHKGVNKYGVKFDTPAYVKKFQSYLGSSEGQSGQSGQLSQSANISVAPPKTQPTTLPQLAASNMKQNLMKQPKQF